MNMLKKLWSRIVGLFTLGVGVKTLEQSVPLTPEQWAELEAFGREAALRFGTPEPTRRPL